MVDTHVASNHPLLSHVNLTQASFIVGHNQDRNQEQDGNAGSETDVAFSSDHDTAVASLLAASLPKSAGCLTPVCFIRVIVLAKALR